MNMNEIQQPQMALKPDQIIEIIIKRRWFFLVPLCIAVTVGLYLALTLPRTYSASTSILVQAQKVPGNYVRSVVSMDINERISTISQQVMSQTNLEKIIDQFGLYEDQNSQNMYLEDKIKDMRKRIEVKLSRSRDGADAFTISFTGEEPERVMRIANALSGFFMDENLKMREAQAVGTSEFLDAELEKTRKKLEEREKTLSDYRTKFMGGLPDELDSNLRTLDRLQEQLLEKQTGLREAKDSIGILTNQIAQTKQMAFQRLNTQRSSLDNGEKPTNETEAKIKLREAQKEYEDILVKYTDNHPDAIKLAKTIARLRDQVKAEEGYKRESDVNNVKKTGPAVYNEENFRSVQLENRLQQLQEEIVRLESDIEKINKAMDMYQKRVEDTPKREQELLSLKRDYSNIQDVYSSLLNRKLEAELSVNMEKKQKGEQFRILDQARLPEKPISPDVRKILIVSIILGLGSGAGIIFLLELFDSSVKRTDDIEKKLGLPVLAVIPKLKQPTDKFRQRVFNGLFAAGFFYAACILIGFLFLNMKGVTDTVRFLKSFIRF